MNHYINIAFPLDTDQKDYFTKLVKTAGKTIKKAYNIDENTYQVIKRYATSALKNGINDNYKKGKNNGRTYGFGGNTLQSIPNKVLNEFLRDKAYDVDMKNACFSIIVYLIKKEFGDKTSDFPTLFSYQKCREDFINEELDKQFFISSLFHPDPLKLKKSAYPKKVNKLLEEINEIQKLCMGNLHLFNCGYDESNHKGKVLSHIVFSVEDRILKEMIKEYESDLRFLKYDGFGVGSNCDKDSLMENCNKISNKYNVDMEIKEWGKPISLDAPPLYTPDAYPLQEEYEEKKKEFEINHFIVRHPLVYYEVYKGEELAYTKGDFRDLVASWKVGNDAFFDLWLCDENRREYQSVKWVPLKGDGGSEYFNSYKGFAIDEVEGDEIDEEVVEEFLKLLLHLTDGDEDAKNYLVKYWAHLFQKPEIMPKTAILFKGVQGAGKDLMMDIIEGILGKDLMFRDDSMVNVVGQFNVGLKNKLIVQLNEVSGAGGHFNKEALKGIITTEEFQINEKREKLIKSQNYIRLILATNNINAISIPYDDRRYLVFKTGGRKEWSFYDRLHEIKKDKVALKSIYNYLFRFKLGDFMPDNPKDRVKTVAYKQLQDLNRNPFYEFLRIFIGDADINDDIIWVEKNKRHYVRYRDVESQYTDWLYSMDYDLGNPKTPTSNPKRNKAVLLECGAMEKTAKLNGKGSTRYYTLDIPNLIIKLDKEHGFSKPEEITI